MTSPSDELPLRLQGAAADTDPARARAAWDAAAAAVLRKARKLADDVDDAQAWNKLSRKTLDGVTVPPLGTPEQLQHPLGKGLPGQAPFARGLGEGAQWDVRAEVIARGGEQAAQWSLAELEGGAHSLWLHLGDDALPARELEVALAGVLLDLAPVTFDAASPDDTLAAAEAYAALLRAKGVAAHPHSNLGFDPLGSALRRGTLQHAHEALGAPLAAVATHAAQLGVRGVVVDATAVHDAGATDVQELAASLALGVRYLRALQAHGVSPAEACARLEFRYAATAEQFPTLAKFRAARMLWHRVAELCGVPPQQRAQRQHAVTSRAMRTRYDPWVNLLRGTLAAFAAGVGGAHAITVAPFDAAIGVPEALGRRIARNTSLLLMAESHLDKVIDPAGGAHAVEDLTDQLARAAWAEFVRIERDGQALEALAPGGWFAEAIATKAQERERQIAKRSRPITGVSEFPHAGESLPARAPYPRGAQPEVRAYATAFEALRDAPSAAPVFLATLGRVAEHTARATFASNALAAGGVHTVSAGACEGRAELLDAFRRSGAHVACLCGTDAHYAEMAATVVDELRRAGARHVLLAGKPPAELKPLFDDAIALGDDVLAFLHRTRAALETAS